jgi:hypothetical protein
VPPTELTPRERAYSLLSQENLLKRLRHIAQR